MASDRDTTTLFTQALNTLNSALAKHRDALPYKPLIAASEKVLADREVGVAVYKSDASNPFDYFTIRFREGSFELVSHGKKDPEIAWKVSQDYLEQVADDPEKYIDNPAKLDWDWLKDRVGLEDA